MIIDIGSDISAGNGFNLVEEVWRFFLQNASHVMVDISGTAASVHYSITARPNCSLSPVGTLSVFTIISLLTLIFSFGFVLIGAWPVLPFAGAELLALGLCFYHVWHHTGDFERLTIDDDKLIVETHEPGHDKRIELNGYWARLVLDCMPDGYCRRLALRSHGREVEFGRHMTSEQRLNLARQLKPRLGGYM
ncbi:MAG: DUF2244 domain-containing protein [Methylotenera sp.]